MFVYKYSVTTNVYFLSGSVLTKKQMFTKDYEDNSYFMVTYIYNVYI